MKDHNENYRQSLSAFARDILGYPLYPYQERVGNAILESIDNGWGETFSVMFARQMGKNQLSAILEAYLLVHMKDGTIVKAAPTFNPQILTSRSRLMSMLGNATTMRHVWTSHGHIVGLAPSEEARKGQIGPRIMFFSASPAANIVGATASLLLEIDEAQNVSRDKFDRDLRPMASCTNATTVLYGTAWTDNTLLASVRAENVYLEQRDGRTRHFTYSWQTLASLNQKYKAFVEKEIERLGEEHVTIRTQYQLQEIAGSDYLLTSSQHKQLVGQHPWEEEPEDESENDDFYYVAGMDIGGEARFTPQQETKKHDSTVITIGKVSYSRIIPYLAHLRIVHHYCWTGMNYGLQIQKTIQILRAWNIQHIVIDKTGLGEGLVSTLKNSMGEERVTGYQFTRPSKSKLTHQLLNFIDSGRLTLYQNCSRAVTHHDECWKQLKQARYRCPGPSLIDMYVDPREGHDDFLISLALCCDAVQEIIPPIVTEDSIIPPQYDIFGDEGRY